MAKYLITGGCGFIGSHLARQLTLKGDQVRVVDDLSSGKKERLPTNVEFILGDVTHKEILELAIKGVDGIFHLAAVSSPQKSITDWAKAHQTNMSSVILIDTLLKSEIKIPIVFASSAAVYGNPETLPLSEKAPLNPLTPYGIDKLGSERHLLTASKLFHLPVTVLRFFNVYGEGQDFDSPYSGVISIFTEKLKRGEKITIFGDGNQLRDFIHVSDVVRFLIAAMKKNTREGAIFNISTGVGTKVNQLLDILENLTKKKGKREYMKVRKGDILASIGDPKLAENAFGMRSVTSLEQGLMSLVKETSA